MKELFVLIALFFSLNSMASMTHKSDVGNEPSQAKKELALKCFSEAVSSGCRSPQEDRQSFRECVKERMDSFSSECETFMSRLYGRKN